MQLTCIEEWAGGQDHADFSAVFDRVNHRDIIYKLCSVGMGGSVLSILNSFNQTNHSILWWMVVGVNWLSCVYDQD